MCKPLNHTSEYMRLITQQIWAERVRKQQVANAAKK